jgi:TRF2-interacting telomeric protein/Rap1 - C terminal domain/Rap1 Myb domain
MAAPVVYEGVRNTAGDGGGLFEGQSLWFSSAVPQRKWFIEKAIANGATVVQLEKQADVLIVDHARKNAPVGTHSYRYIEQSIKNGTLEDLADHVVGPASRTDRPVGSTTTMSKGTRSRYTEEEDQLLWNWVKPFEDRGEHTAGNEIYKQLETARGNGRHTYQSWRDRWLKYVKFQDKQITENVYAGDVEDEDNAGGQPTRQATPRRRRLDSAQVPTPSPRRTAVAASQPAGPSDQTRPQAGLSSTVDAETMRAREALQRKFGRILPTSPSSLNARYWEQVPVHQSPHRAAQSGPVRIQRQQAGLGTHIPEVQSSGELEAAQSALLNLVPSQSDRPTQGLQVTLEEFTDEEYELLMNAADHITSVGEGIDDDSWKKMAENYPSHSATAWREFWEEKVKPDYGKQKELQIKKEQVSQEENFDEQDTQQDVTEERTEGVLGASAGREESHSQSLSEGEINERLDDPVAAKKNDKTAQEAHENDGLDSLFESQASSSSSYSEPYACKWLGCDVRLPNMKFLILHIPNAHKPTLKVVADEGGWMCRWDGCPGFKIDEYGNKIAFDLQTREEWVKHYIDEHLTFVNRKYGPGPTIDEVNKGRRESRNEETLVQLKNRESESESESEVEEEEGFVVSDQKQPPVQEPGELEAEESEEAEVTQSSESSAIRKRKGNAEVVDLTIDDDSRDRSQRLKKVPRRPPIKDLGFSYVDKAVGSSPPPPMQETPGKDMDTRKSPRFQPLSPSSSKPVEPNEARKRSASKGTNSQESNPDKAVDIEVIEEQPEEIEQSAMISSPRKRSREPEPPASPQESPELPVATAFGSRAKRTKQRHDDDQSMEIPSTPEHRTILGELLDDENDDEDLSMLNGSPTPRPRQRSGFGIAGRTPTRRANLSQDEDMDLTSPLHISMVSDPDVEIAPSPSVLSASTRQEDLTPEPDLHFETAPNTMTLWGTAPSEEIEDDDLEDDEFETAPEPKAKGRERLDTQSLFARSVPDIDDDEGDPFALPEPEGGWPDDIEEDTLGGPLKELPIPTSYQAQADDDSEEDDDDVSSIASICDFVAEQCEDDPMLDQATLLRAIQATSGINKKLILDTYDFLLSAKSLPQNTRGCWSERDDQALRGRERVELRRVGEKHGREAMERRREWLGIE